MSREWEQDEEYQRWLNNPTYIKYQQLNDSLRSNNYTVLDAYRRLESYTYEADKLRRIMNGMAPETLPNIFAKLKECDVKIGECMAEVESAIETENKIKSEMSIIGDELFGIGYEPYGVVDNFIYVIPDRVRYGAIERNVKKKRSGVVEYNHKIMPESTYNEMKNSKKWYEFWK